MRSLIFEVLDKARLILHNGCKDFGGQCSPCLIRFELQCFILIFLSRPILLVSQTPDMIIAEGKADDDLLEVREDREIRQNLLRAFVQTAVNIFQLPFAEMVVAVWVTYGGGSGEAQLFNVGLAEVVCGDAAA